ncbi:hypothetical protein GCM10027040_36170 [Halomonas shantousis]
MTERIVSPCVGLCSTTVGDRVCRGCQRTDREIHDWFGFGDGERRLRVCQLDALRIDVAGRYLRVVDAERLEVQLLRYGIRFRDAQPPLSRAVELLRVGRTRINDITRYGLVPCGLGVGLEPVMLYQALHAELMQAAEARLNSLSLDESLS